MNVVGKNEDFSNPPKSTKMALSIDPGASKARLLIKKLDFWPPFWHRFFDFFQKWRKCEISEEYNAKRGSEPSKTFHFRIDFSLNFHVFSEPPSWGHFWRVQAPVYTQKYDFGAIYDYPTAQKSALETTFSAKRAPKVEYPSWVGASWSRPGRDLAPKTVQGRIFLDLGPFLVDFGRMFDEFWRIFKDFPHILDMIFVRILAIIFQGIFSKTVKPQAHEARKHNKFTNHKAANPQSIILKPWPGGMRVSD